MATMMHKSACSKVAGKATTNVASNIALPKLAPQPATASCPCGKARCNGVHTQAVSTCPCGMPRCNGRHASHVTRAIANPAQVAALEKALPPSATDLGARHSTVLQHFPKSLSADDYMSRVEIALAGYGFTGDNTIAMSNLCRDESCMVLEDKIEAVFGSCFSTHGLGGVLTCGVIGIKAGLSHSPVVDGKERYVFFSFPHIAIDSNGTVGGISRPNRPGDSSACGALIAVTGMLKNEGLEGNCKQPGEHDPLEPEFSILKQRLARRLTHEKADHSKLSLVSVTQAAERTITSDLEYLIEKAVDPKKADYAVFTGVQIHNWAADLDDASVPSLEFVSVGKSYVVVDGEKHFLDLHKVPALSPRQLKVLAALSTGSSVEEAEWSATHAGNTGMIQEIPRDYLMKRLGGAGGSNTKMDVRSPKWNEYVKTTYTDANPGAPQMDGTPNKAFETPAPPAEEQKKGWFTSFLFGNGQ